MIYLHIGRNKAGSTTLQDFFVKNAATLEQHNIHYGLYGHLKDSVPGILGFDFPTAIADYARANPGKSILISHEFMLPWEAIHAEIMAEELHGLPVKIIVHIRPYPSWICSNYAQDIRIGESDRNFDDYFESFRPKLSVWPDLRRWGELFGWRNVVVRLVDARHTPWHDLTSDFLAIMGLNTALDRPLQPSNQAPHWAITELLRALAPLQIGPGATAMLSNLLQKSLHSNPLIGREIEYLTQAQRREAAKVYADDITAINAVTDSRLEIDPHQVLPERMFLPAFEQLPPAILQDFAARASTWDFTPFQAESTAALQKLGVRKRPLVTLIQKYASALRRPQ